jgi:hypothetical protein
MSTYEINGVTVKTHIVNGSECVYWCSDWSQIDSLGLNRIHTNGRGNPYAQSVRYTR